MMKGKVEKVEKEGERRGKGRGGTKREGKRGNEEGRGMKKVHRGFLCS